ncbi:hypothetical protein ACJX0J_032612, partial [Zea mays]
NNGQNLLFGWLQNFASIPVINLEIVVQLALHAQETRTLYWRVRFGFVCMHRTLCLYTVTDLCLSATHFGTSSVKTGLHAVHLLPSPYFLIFCATTATLFQNKMTFFPLAKTAVLFSIALWTLVFSLSNITCL